MQFQLAATRQPTVEPNSSRETSATLTTSIWKPPDVSVGAQITQTLSHSLPVSPLTVLLFCHFISTHLINMHLV